MQNLNQLLFEKCKSNGENGEHKVHLFFTIYTYMVFENHIAQVQNDFVVQSQNSFFLTVYNFYKFNRYLKITVYKTLCVGLVTEIRFCRVYILKQLKV